MSVLFLTSISYGILTRFLKRQLHICTKRYSYDISTIVHPLVTGSIRERSLINLQNDSSVLNPIVP